MVQRWEKVFMNTLTGGDAPPMRNRLVREHVHDPYRSTGKLTEPAVCPICNAVYLGGRWQWTESWPADSKQTVCQACRRIKDGYPGGVMTLRGSFVLQHKAEILNLARNEEIAEKSAHPLHRIMKVEERPDAILISTTDIHLPRRIGAALQHAYKGELELGYGEESYFVRVNWTRE